MRYIECAFTIEPFEPWADLLAAELGEIGFESFVLEPPVLKAYVQESGFDQKSIHILDVMNTRGVRVEMKSKSIPKTNWNKEWEMNFEPVAINDRVRLRASFHEPDSSYEYDIVINPKMSFGTGHHETTRLMLSAMLNTSFHDKTVLDMGAGTGVLAIFASMLGAKSILAVEIEPWAAENIEENLELNGINNVDTVCGDQDAVGDKKFDVILANINKNVLIDQMKLYARALNDGGRLFISGFYENDVADLTHFAGSYGLKYVEKNILNDWAILEFVK